jgi:anthranilate phosphoribosyltransferase
MLSEAITALLGGATLTRAAARAVLDEVVASDLPRERIAALLALLQVRGATADELSGFADALAAAAVPYPADPGDAVDTCGTGGDGRRTLNLSTLAALVAAAAGATVLKHGNRAATSACGSADLLERLGIPIDLPPAAAAAAARRDGFAFLFARSYHPVLKRVAPIRAALGFPTVFNLLGPLLNPARVRRQVVGVMDARAQEQIAATLQLRGCEHAVVLHGAGGLDEASPLGPLRVLVVRRDAPQIRAEQRDPAELGIARCTLAELQVASVAESCARAEAIVAGERGAARDAVLLNAALALEVAGRARDWRDGFAQAARAIDDGRARRTLENLRERRAVA